MADLLGEDWPDARLVRERRRDFAERVLAERAPPIDPLAELPGEEIRRREEAAKSAAFWRQHERRPLAVRLGLHSADRRLQRDDPPDMEEANGEAQEYR